MLPSQKIYQVTLETDSNKQGLSIYDWILKLALNQAAARVCHYPFLARQNMIKIDSYPCLAHARGFGSVVKHSTADPEIASSIPPHSN